MPSSMPTPSSEARAVRRWCPTWVARSCGILVLGGSALAQSLVNGGVVSGTLATPGERDTYTFDARIGDRFELRVVDVDASDFEPRIELYSPLGVLLSTDASADVAVVDTQRVVFGSDYRPGTYTVVISNASSAGSQTGAYDLRFVLFPGAQTGGELLDGVRIFGEVERGELDAFTFTTVAGQTVEGTVIALHGGTFHMRVERFSASGHSEGVGGDVCHFTTTTWPGGVQMLVVSDGSPGAAGTGRYSIVVHGVAAAPPYPPNLFLPGERQDDPLLLDNAGDPGLGPRIGSLGEPFNVSLECTFADSPSIYALVLSLNAHGAVSTPLGWSYLDAPALLRKVGTHVQSVEPWFTVPTGLPVPADPALVGVSYTVQGVCGGFSGGLRLSSAITQTIGG